MATRQDLAKRLRAYEERRDALLAKLSRAGFIWHGTVQRRLLTCGRPACRCHQDPAARHGPYAYWTTKVGGKTVSRLLGPVEADLYEEWVENRRWIERALDELKALSAKAARVILELRSGQGAGPA